MHQSYFKTFAALIITINASSSLAVAEQTATSTINPEINSLLKKAVSGGIEKFKPKAV